MPPAFGVWLKNYKGGVRWLEELSASWRRALDDDYLKPLHYRSKQDVLRRMKYRTERHVQLHLAIYRAWEHYRQEGGAA